MKKRGSEEKLYRYRVEHPVYGWENVVATDGPMAVRAALWEWGGDWREEARYCTWNCLGTAARPRCRQCDNEFGSPGQAGGLCSACAREREFRQYQEARRRGPDRRARHIERGK